MIRSAEEDKDTWVVARVVKSFISPLAVFLPAGVPTARRAGMSNNPLYRKDWSLTFLGSSFFIYGLASGVFQIKYLYAEHVYDWTAEQLSYYIAFTGGVRAFHLLILLPCECWITLSNSANYTDNKRSPSGYIQTCPSSSVVSVVGTAQQQRSQGKAQTHERPALF